MNTFLFSLQDLKYYLQILINPIPNCYGKRFQKYYDLLNQSQYWKLKKLQAYQFKKLKSIIYYSNKNIPYYHDLWQKKKIEAKIEKSI